MKLVDYDNFDWSQPTYWLPDLTKVTPLEVQEDDTPVVNISFDALESQFFTISGIATMPTGFIPGEVTDVNGNWIGYNNVNFEVLNEDGEQIAWEEITKIAVSTDEYSYKLKIPQAGDYLVRVNYEIFDSTTGMSDFSGYFIDFKNNGTLVSDKKIQHIPVIDESTFLDDYNADMCWNEGYFWLDDMEAYEQYQSELEATTPIGDENIYDDIDMKEPFYFGKCYSQYPTNWKPDFEGTVTLDNQNKAFVQNLDFAVIENSAYKIVGSVVGLGEFIPNHDWDNLSNIRIEAMDATTGNWLGDGHIQFEDGKAETSYSYSFKLNDVVADTKVAIKIVKEENKDGMWEQESYFINPGDDGILGNTDDYFVSEDQINWVEQKVDGQYWTMWLPDPEQTGFITLSEEKTITLAIDYGAGESNYEQNKLALSGTIKLSEPVKLGYSDNGWLNNIRVEAIKKETGEWIGNVDAKYASTCSTPDSCTELEYEIVFPQIGNYVIKVTKEIDGTWEEYYYNFGVDNNITGTDGIDSDGKLISGQKVEWEEAEQKVNTTDMLKNWMPNPEQTGFISLQEKKTLIIDFTQFENSMLFIAGEVIMPIDFLIGEYCTNSSDQVGICEWSGGKVGYNNWYGSKNIRIEAISKENGKWLGSIDVKKKIENTNKYEFKLSLGDIDEVGEKFILKINKEESGLNNWKHDEIYYNFGLDHSIGGSDDKLISGKKIDWIEAEKSEYQDQNWNNWMPNPEKTGWLETTKSIVMEDGLSIDVSSVGANDYFIKGTVVFKSDFDISNENSFADVSVLDAASGMWLGNAPINSDGTYEINLGDSAGEYILQINYSYNDYKNWENSWWKNKIYDFGVDKTYGTSDDQIVNDSDVMWVPVLDDTMLKADIATADKCWIDGNFWDDEKQECYEQPRNWKPNINPVMVNDTVVSVVESKKVLSGVDIDLSQSLGKTLNIAISNIPITAKNPYVYVVDPLSYGGSWLELKNDAGIYKAAMTELKIANYTVEFGYEVDGRQEHFFIKDTNDDITDGVGIVPGFEVQWVEIDSTKKMWGPSSADTTYIDLLTDVNLSVIVSTPSYNELNVTLGGFNSDENINVDFKSLTTPYGRYENLISNSGGEINTNFNDVKNGTYILSFWYDGNEYTYDNGTNSLKKDAMWVAYDTNNVRVCPTGTNNDNWNCNWEESSTWQWRPDVEPLEFSDSNKALTLAMPTALKVYGSIDLDPEFAGKMLDVSVYKYNENDWNWKNFLLDTNGDTNGSIKINGGDGYRIELWVEGLGGYVYKNDGSWISQNNSWSEDPTTHIWGPNADTLISINDDLNLGTVTIGANFKTVTITVQNLDTDGDAIIEDVWVSLESDTQGYFGNGNANWSEDTVTYSDTVVMKVPQGEYRLLAFPMNHKGGFASDGDTDGNETDVTTFTKLGWNWENKDLVSVSTSDLTLTVQLPTAAQTGIVSGTVDCGTSDCSGWIDAWSKDNGGKGVEVKADGTYSIKGLDAGTYDIYYDKFDGTISLFEEAVSVTVNQTTQLDMTKTTDNVYAISGNMDGPVGVYATLVKVSTTDATAWSTVTTTTIDENGDFDFGEVAKPDSSSVYFVVGSVATQIDGGFTVKFGGAQEIGTTGHSVDFGTNTTTETITVILN